MEIVLLVILLVILRELVLLIIYFVRLMGLAREAFQMRLARKALVSKKDSLEVLLKKAKQGDAEAQNDLGLMYRFGQGVLQNDKEAVRWYHLAAEQGHANAQFNLGVMYATWVRCFSKR